MAAGENGPETLDVLNKVIQHNTSLEPGEDYTGEIHTDSAGQRFPVIKKEVQVLGRRPARDVDGKILYHLRPDGSRHRPMMESFVKETRVEEYIKFPLGNGITQKVRNFRPTPEQLERQRVNQENERARGELERLLSAGGKTVADVVDAIKGAVGVAPRQDPEDDTPTDGMARYQALRQHASEMGLEVKGTGKNGAVRLADLEAAIEAAPQPNESTTLPEPAEVGAAE